MEEERETLAVEPPAIGRWPEALGEIQARIAPRFARAEVRERVIRIFPCRVSVIRLLGALLMEQDEQWSTGKRYVDMATYWQWRDRQDHGRPGERPDEAVICGVQ